MYTNEKCANAVRELSTREYSFEQIGDFGDSIDFMPDYDEGNAFSLSRLCERMEKCTEIVLYKHWYKHDESIDSYWVIGLGMPFPTEHFRGVVYGGCEMSHDEAMAIAVELAEAFDKTLRFL